MRLDRAANLDQVRRYASGKAPYLAVPVWSIADNRYIAATFDRRHLQAAVSCPHIKHAHYDEVSHILIMAGPRAEYRLKNLSRVPIADRTIHPWQISENLRRWAATQRKRVDTMRATTAEQRKATKWREEIGKLERRRDKLRAHQPRSPLAPRLCETSDWSRNSELKWHLEKGLRQEIGWLAHRPRTTWAAFYEQVGKIIGSHVDSGQRHDRVCTRRRGPSVTEYLKQLPQHLSMARKPYRSKADYLSPEVFARHREAQVEYLTTMSEIRAINDAIAGHVVQIKQLEDIE